MGGRCHATNAGTAGGKIFQYRAGHAGVCLADTLGHHAVIGAQHQHGTVGKIRRLCPHQGGGILHHRFQPAQTAQGFGKCGPVGVRGGTDGFIRRRHRF